MKVVGKFLGLLVFVATLSVNAQAQNAILVSNETNTAAIAPSQGTEVVSNYQEGIAITKDGKKYGWVNAYGQEIVSPQFDEVRLFHNHYAPARKADKWAFYNQQGKRITPFRYDWVSNFEEGLAAVQIDGLWGYINEQGFIVIQPQFERAGNFDNGITQVVKDNETYTINKQGKRVSVETTLQAQGSTTTTL